jgi:menaquinol-cytochrome c reductase cytochrome b/c subunit
MAEKEQSFDKVEQSTKTYSLVELVRAPTEMIDKGPENTVFAFPLVALVEIVLTLVVAVALLTMSFAVNAPLEEIANPNLTTDPAKAPWYLMGLQEMLEHGHPTLMAVMMPTLMVLFVMAIPYLDNSREGTGKWFTNARGKKLTMYTAIYTLILMPLYIVLDSKFPLREILRGSLPDFILQYVFPAIFMGLIVTLPVIVLFFSKPTAREIVLVLFTILFVGAIVFTLAGFLFRGPGFELYWPWDMPGGYNPFDNL